MSKHTQLVIVESPAKAKTIERYLGGEYQVLSSVGHIRAIPKKTKDGQPPIDIKNDFKTVYEEGHHRAQKGCEGSWSG